MSNSPASSLVGPHLVTKDESGKLKQVPASSLDGKHVAFYFSAHWCPPCRQFTPRLSSTYSKLKKQDKDFEIVFVSSDRDNTAFEDYFGTMPWLAVPFEAADVRKQLMRRYNVSGIPCLVVLDSEGALLNANARAAVAADPDGASFPWTGGSEGRTWALSNPLVLLLLLTALWHAAKYLWSFLFNK